MTIEERRTVLEKEMRRLNCLDAVKEYLENRINNAENDIQYLKTSNRVIGYETEQATNGNGDLLWKTAKYYWRGFTKEQLERDGTEEDLATMEPYYNAIEETYELTEDEISEYGKDEIMKNEIIIEIMKKAIEEL